jgi:arsenate reductase
MAAALFNDLSDLTRARGISAGTSPGDRVHADVLAVMRERGIDLVDVVPTKLTDDLAAGANLLVTMGCGEACPVVPGAEREDWPLEDPERLPLEGVRQLRDEVERRVRNLLGERGWLRDG